MLETLKKKVSKNVMWRVIVSLIIIGIILGFWGKSMLMFIQGPVPIVAGMDYDAEEGSYVSFDVTYVIDEFVRQTSKNTETKKETLKNISYLTYFEEDGYFFGVELPSSKESEMDQYIENTWSWLAEEIDTLTDVKQVKGTWTPLTGTRLRYYQETITEDLGEEFLDMALPYYIDTNKVGGNTHSAVYISFAVIIIALFYLIYTLIRFFGGSHQAKIKKYLVNNTTVSMEHIEADFASAVAVSKTIWVGKRWTFHVSGIYADILENKDFVWGYYYYRSGRHSESTLRLYDTSKKLHGLSASEKEAKAALDVYSKQNPQMVLGYTKELEKMFQKDFQGFLNLRYNRPPEDFAEPEPDPWNYENSAETGEPK